MTAYSIDVNVLGDMQTLYRSGLPQDVASRDEEDIAIFSAMMALVEGYVAGLLQEVQIGTSHGVFLDEHARDKGLRRAAAEADPALKRRLQFPPTAGTVEAIVDALKLLLNLDTVYLVELPRSSMFLDIEQCADRGVRMGGGRGVVIALIPESADAAASSLALVRSKKSAGKIAQVEEFTA